MTQLSYEQKKEINQAKTQMLLQLAQWKAAQGQGDQNEITGIQWLAPASKHLA